MLHTIIIFLTEFAEYTEFFLFYKFSLNDLSDFSSEWTKNPSVFYEKIIFCFNIKFQKI
jgi:hypothetical protein